MKFAAALAAAGPLASAAAQVTYDSASDTWSCPVANGSYCAGDSLSTPVVILCTNGKGTPGNCVPHNWNRPPINVYYSPCYQSSPTAGDAACAKDCVVYPDSGLPFAVPGTCNATYYNEIDVTGGAVKTSCFGNGTCTDTWTSNSTAASNSSTTSSSTSASGTMLPTTSGAAGPTNTASGTGSSASSTSSAPVSAKGAASVLGAAPLAGYAVLGLLALAL